MEVATRAKRPAHLQGDMQCADSPSKQWPPAGSIETQSRIAYAGGWGSATDP